MVARIGNEVDERGEEKDPEFQRNAMRRLGTTAEGTEDDHLDEAPPAKAERDSAYWPKASEYAVADMALTGSGSLEASAPSCG